MIALVATTLLAVLEPRVPVTRRAALVGLGSSPLLFATRSLAVDEAVPSPPASPAVLLRSTLAATRSLEPGARAPTAAISRANYGLESADVYYPEWALGRWRVTSTLT